jgi:hypothetical protein
VNYYYVNLTVFNVNISSIPPGEDVYVKMGGNTFGYSFENGQEARWNDWNRDSMSFEKEMVKSLKANLSCPKTGYLFKKKSLLKKSYNVIF